MTVVIPRRGTTIHVVVRLDAPLSHGAFGQNTGNAMMLRRVPVVSVEGIPSVPAVSGNALRGAMRRQIMRELFEHVGLNRDTMEGRQWDRLYGSVANGGHLESSETKADPQRTREIREALPPVSLFGAAFFSWMLPGHMSVGWLWPRCRETVRAGLVSCGEDVEAETLVAEIGLVRHVDREWQTPEVSGVTPMPTMVETMSTGTTLESNITTMGEANEIETSCIAHGLDLLTGLGGKGGAGLGRVSITHDGDANAYREWLAASQETAKAALTKLAVSLK